MSKSQAEYDLILLDKYWFGDGCWLFDGCLDHRGYAILRANGKNYKGHRRMYEMFVGPIPEGDDVHHICGERSCGRPAHLRSIPKRLHGQQSSPATARMACIHGHEYTPENTMYRPNGHRRCRECTRRLALESYHRRKGSGNVPRN